MEYTTRAVYKERLQTHFTKYPRRPILTHLNADSSWLISIPIPQSFITRSTSDAGHNDESNATTSPYCYHLIIDPWLDGRITVGIKTFISFAHNLRSAFQTFQDVLDMIGLIEEEAATAYNKDHPGQDRQNQAHYTPKIDLVISSHFAQDHLDRATLIQIDPKTPLMTVDGAIGAVKSWKHFDVVELMPDFQNLDILESHSYEVLPPWLKVGRIPSGERFPALHHGLLIAFESDQGVSGVGGGKVREGIIYTPHGVFPKQVKPLVSSSVPDESVNGGKDKQMEGGGDAALPQIRYLALLHGLARAWDKLTGTVNMGWENGLALQELTGAKYWIPTHDEVLDYTGIMGYLQNKEMGTVENVVEKKTSLTQLKTGQNIDESPEGTCFIKELGNGEVLSLA